LGRHRGAGYVAQVVVQKVVAIVMVSVVVW
jgi:hypothetical protein